MADIQAKLKEIVTAIEEARAMPMSASCIVNRGELLELIEDLRGLLPTELRQAQWVLRDRDEVIEEGRREGAKLVEEARIEQERLVSKTTVVAEAHRSAERLLDEAENETTQMRQEVDEYMDAKLANFEVVLHKTLRAVERGRDKLRGRQEIDDLHDVDHDAEPPLPG